MMVVIIFDYDECYCDFEDRARDDNIQSGHFVETVCYVCEAPINSHRRNGHFGFSISMAISSRRFAMSVNHLAKRFDEMAI